MYNCLMRLFKIKFPEYQDAAFFRHSPVPVSDLWHHPRYKKHSYIQGHSLQGFFFLLAVCWGELAWYCFFPYQKFPSLPGKQDFEYGRKLPFITYGMVEYVCVYERESERERAQSCLTLCYPMDCGSSVRGILQARILWWVAISSSRGSS